MFRTDPKYSPLGGLPGLCRVTPEQALSLEIDSAACVQDDSVEPELS